MKTLENLGQTKESTSHSMQLNSGFCSLPQDVVIWIALMEAMQIMGESGCVIVPMSEQYAC